MNIDKFIESLTSEELYELTHKLGIINIDPPKEESRLLLSDWVTNFKNWTVDLGDIYIASVRLAHILIHASDLYDAKINGEDYPIFGRVDVSSFKYWETIDTKQLMRVSNCGKKTIAEFIELRGY